LILSDKIRFGRNTYGLVFANTTSYTINKIIEFALSHIYDLTTKTEDINLDNIKHHISCQDIPSLIWGFICTVYPNGFRYRRACISDPVKCNYIVEETLNVNKLQFTNIRALTDWQKTHMYSRQPKTKDLVSINRYKEELSKIQKSSIVLNKDTSSELKFTLKSPSIHEYIESGHKWISDIVSIVDKALGVNPNENERNKIITEYGQSSAMRNYAHWVDSIELDTNIIDDRRTIDNNLNILSADDVVREEFVEEVIKYINRSTISVIGIPVYDCPSCKTIQSKETDVSIYQNIIPLDVVQLFFGLLTQRVNKITQR